MDLHVSLCGNGSCPDVRKSEFPKEGSTQDAKRGHIYMLNNVVTVVLSTSASLSLCVYIHVYMYS